MRVGLYFDVRNPLPWQRPWPELYARTIDVASAADQQGAHAIWFSEHHLFDDGYLPQPLVLAAAVAARTRRVRLGTAVMLPNLRHPLHLAEEAAIVDLISNGRLELGLGVGYRATEFEAVGASLTNRYDDFERIVVESRRLWAGGALPPPAQPEIPLWGGFFGPRGARLAGRLGIGLLTLDGSLLGPYADALAVHGHSATAARMSGFINMIVCDDPERTWAQMAPHAAYQANSYVAHTQLPDETPLAPVSPDRLRVHIDLKGQKRPRLDASASARVHVVQPSEAISLVRLYTEGLPVEHVFFWGDIAGMPDELVNRHVELVSTAVAPALAPAEPANRSTA